MGGKQVDVQWPIRMKTQQALLVLLVYILFGTGPQNIILKTNTFDIYVDPKRTGAWDYNY